MHTSTVDRRTVVQSIAAMVVAVLAVLGTADTTAAADQPTKQPSQEDASRQQLAERFAPILMLKRQTAACSTDGEQFRPSRVDIVLDNREIALRQVGRDDPVVQWAPRAADIFGLGEGFFLDFPGSSLSPGCIYERDFWKYTAGRPATIYAHIVQQPDEPGLVFLQYWFYWYYNDWNNKHESDWEGITLKFEASSVDQALGSQPVAVGFSQHEGGERAAWDDAKLERVGDHPVVYSSAGSHASYFGSALYLGRTASEGFGCDNTDGPSNRVEPEVVVLPDAITDPNDPLAWLAFQGRWGERQDGAFNGPTGPSVKDRWLGPAPWFSELRATSVVIPTGGSQAASVIGAFCSAVEGGSSVLVSFTVSPGLVVVGVLILGGLVSFLVRRTDWSPVAPTPIRRRRRAGQIIRATAGIYAGSPFIYALLGTVYLPAALITGLLARLIEFVPFIGSLLSLFGRSGGANIIVAALVGSVANLAAFVVVNTMVADYLSGERRGVDAAITSARRAWQRRRDIAGALLRAFVIVAALIASVVGVPWGIRQLVRYQLAAQVVMLEDRTGRDALARSTELVRGRWLHTAIVVAVLNALVASVGLVTALLLLVLATGIPLWLFSALVSVVYAVIVPLAGIALTLLYGDAAAEHDEATHPEPLAIS